MTSLPPLSQIDIQEWMETLSEHPLFLSQQTANPYQKKQFRQLWDELKEAAYELHDVNKFFEIIDELEKVQLEELEYIDSHPHIVEPVYKALVNHMIMEQNMVKKSIQGQTTLEEELSFIRDEAAQHTDLLGKTVDPVDMKSKQFSLATQSLASKMEQANQFDKHIVSDLINSNEMAKKAYMDVQNGRMRTLLTLQMIHHEMTEAKLASKRLAQFQKHGLLSI